MLTSFTLIHKTLYCAEIINQNIELEIDLQFLLVAHCMRLKGAIAGFLWNTIFTSLKRYIDIIGTLSFR